MKLPARLVSAVCLATLIASGYESATGAEGIAVQQDLVNLKKSSTVTSAVWKRQADSYTLQIFLDRPRIFPATVKPASPEPQATGARPLYSVSAEEMRRLGIVNVADALLQLVPQNSAGYQPFLIGDGHQAAAGDFNPTDRATTFIRNTIENLRGVTPQLVCGNTPDTRLRRVEVWLLRADDTQIRQATFICKDPEWGLPTRTDGSFSYGYSIADGAQAVAAAIWIDDDFYVEKLQPLAAAPAAP